MISLINLFLVIDRANDGLLLVYCYHLNVSLTEYLIDVLCLFLQILLLLIYIVADRFGSPYLEM